MKSSLSGGITIDGKAQGEPGGDKFGEPLAVESAKPHETLTIPRFPKL
jgi:hypothetical protein